MEWDDSRAVPTVQVWLSTTPVFKNMDVVLEEKVSLFDNEDGPWPRRNSTAILTKAQVDLRLRYLAEHSICNKPYARENA
jgi:hypothetical protein